MPRDHAKFICDVNDLAGVLSGSNNLQSFLQKIAEMVVKHMRSEICSIYLYNDLTQELVLKATKGLRLSAIDRVRLTIGEGLTGMALKEMRPICEKKASESKSYRYFPDIGEESYESFLAVPLIRGQMRIGVLVIQSAKKNYFKEEDVRAFQVVASQLANTLENAKALMALDEKQPSIKQEEVKSIKFIKGKQAVEGFAIGEAVTYDQSQAIDSYLPDHSVVKYGLDDFFEAVQESQKQLQEAQKRVEDKLSDAASLIFTAQILILKDDAVISMITEKIKEGVPAPSAIIQTVEVFVKRIDCIKNDYLREKKYDVIDIGKRLLGNLLGLDEHGNHYRKKIVVTREVLPSNLLKFSAEEAAGIILLSGGVTSHVSILARSLGIPLVICEEPRLLSLPINTKILLDGEQGNIYIDPTDAITRPIKEREGARLIALKVGQAVKDKTFTKDKQRVKLLANINLLGDLEVARKFKAEGIGLYRTEFPFIIRSNFPTEEEQYIIYGKLVGGLRGKEITFRTLDVGGDKVLSYYDYGKEENPFLGMRSIRFSLRHKDIFRQQLRAILRAGLGEDLKIMFPMISSIDEFLEAKAEVKTCIGELKKQGIPGHPDPAIGMMVELPSVVELADDFAKVADFFSIGTNDFIQYMLAVDRTNEKVADLYLPYHPSVLRALKRVVFAATSRGKDVSICGQMAQDERYTKYLLGIGIRKFSLDAASLPKIQKIIEAITIADAIADIEKIAAIKLIGDLREMFKQ